MSRYDEIKDTSIKALDYIVSEMKKFKDKDDLLILEVTSTLNSCVFISVLNTKDETRFVENLDAYLKTFRELVMDNFKDFINKKGK